MRQCLVGNYSSFRVKLIFQTRFETRGFIFVLLNSNCVIFFRRAVGCIEFFSPLSLSIDIFFQGLLEVSLLKI